MLDRPKIDRDIHDLVGEANALLLLITLQRNADDAKASDLIARMMACADEADESGKSESARNLSRVAGLLARRYEPNP